MVLSNEAVGDLYDKHLELCNKLNLDVKIVNEAWERFELINKNFTLEGDALHWVGCAIYVACWRSTSTHSQNRSQAISVNLTILLRHCNCSLAQFFFKMKQWSDMANMPDEFKRRIEYLEGSVAVAYNVFKEYEQLFVLIFKSPEHLDLDHTRLQRNRKSKTVSCTTLKVFEFCWTLFITIKCEDASYNNDLVTLCHLLIAICDWAFTNALLADRRDLLNPAFDGLPVDWSQPSYMPPSEAPCIVGVLCPSANITDVKYIKEYQFKRSLKNLFDQGILVGDEPDSGDVFSASLFEQNYKNISSAYEENFMKKGDFDEKIFLAEFKRKLIFKKQARNEERTGRQNACEGGAEFSKTMVFGNECLTPLTGRKYLGPKETSDATPLVTATESIARLNTVLQGRQPAPSEALIDIFQSCVRNPTDRIDDIVSNLGDIFVNAHGPDNVEVARKRLQLSTTLFYKFIESILQNERAIQSDISAIVEKDVFYECMFACCLEIVIYSYNSRQKFPWVLDVLNIQPYNFIKVIELIIRSKDKLSRDTIKHLNMIEEIILSSLVWKSDSLIWEAIKSSEKEVPKFEETALPGHLQNESSFDNFPMKGIVDSKPIQSPGPSAIDRFQSPITHNSAINRELFPTVPSSQSLLQHTHLMIKDRSGNTRMIPIVNNDVQKIQPPVQQIIPKRIENTTPPRPRRTGGLSIIFRKFYNLSGERMEHLCTHLKITDTDTKRKIWTAFEELVRKNECELMKDRNLDQLLMCAVYMICKLTKLNMNFAEIIKSYRSQPQATSDIYRQVLIRSKASQINDSGLLVEVAEERGDLIQFYNMVIIQAMKKFAQRFVTKSDEINSEILLSPLPAARGQVVQVYDNISIKPLESPTLTFGNGKVMNYYFSRSPSKDLKDINRAIKGTGVTGKRLLVEGENDMPNAKRIGNRKVQSLIEERRNQNVE